MGKFLLVFDTPPTREEDLREHAIWGAGVSAGASSAEWGSGMRWNADEQRWVQPPDSPMPGRFYFAVVAFQGTDVLAASRLIPFGIDSESWPVHGTPCEDEGVIRGECDHPSRLMACRGEDGGVGRFPERPQRDSRRCMPCMGFSTWVANICKR